MEHKGSQPHSRPPAGGGRLRTEGACFALLGFGELDERILDRELNERLAFTVNDLSKAGYAIFHPVGAPAEKDWPEALRREEAGTLILLPYPVYKLWLLRSADETDVRAKDRPCVIAHYLTHAGDWAQSINGADLAAEKLLLDRHISLADAYYAAGDITSLLLLLDALAVREKDWVKTGRSDGFYTLLLTDRYLTRSTETGAAETTLRLLEYKHSRFSDACIRAAGEAQTQYALGGKKHPPVYWSPGTVHTLGVYPQTAAGTDRTPIEWLVLEQKGERALVISRFVLDRKAYNEDRIGITWDTCTLRKWLGRSFVRKAFSAEERTRLIRVRVPAAVNSRYSTSPGADTYGRLFLLSPEEADRYFASDEERRAGATGYADIPGMHKDVKYQKDGRMTLMWWLRGNSSQQQLAPYVDGVGHNVESGNYADYCFYGLRPAMWITTD